MEFSSIIYGVIAFFLFFYFYLRRSSNSYNPIHKPPPEATGALPILGYLHLIGGSGGAELPHIKLGSMADKLGPIFTIRLGVHRVAVVSSWRLAKELFTAGNDTSVSSRPKVRAVEHLSNNFSLFPFSPYGDYWRQIRKLTSVELLSNRRVELLSHVCVSEIAQSMKELYTLWEEEKDGSGRVLVDMKKWFVDLNLNVVMKMVAGKRLSGDGEEIQQCRKVVRDFFHLAGLFVPGDALPWLRWFDFGGYERKMKETAKELDAIVGKWVEEHRRKRDRGGDKAEDFLDVMLSVVKSSDFGGLHDADTIIKSTCEVYQLQYIIYAI